eukprot:jgi/Tetstr1/420993/TSEL_012053.t1
MVSDAAAFGMEDAVPASPSKSSQNRRRTSRHSDTGMSVEVGAPSTTGGPRKARTPRHPRPLSTDLKPAARSVAAALLHIAS